MQEFAAQLGGLELRSQADVPAPRTEEPDPLPETAPQQAQEIAPAPMPASTSTETTENIPAWLSELMAEAKNVAGSAPTSNVESPESTEGGQVPSAETSAPAAELPAIASSDSSSELKDPQDPPKRVWKDDWS